MSSTSPLQISAVIITLNEEANIARTLEPLMSLCDEVIIVDCGSTDKTQEICEGYGVKFLTHEWKGYGATKNWGNEQAKHDWILGVDADEVVSETLAANIRIAMEAPAVDAYKLSRLTNYCGTWIRHGSWYPDILLRLFNKTKFHWDLKDVHETLVSENNGTVASIKGDLEHYSYVDEADHLARINRYTDLGAERMFKEGKKAGFVKLILSPFWKFIGDYVFRMGFLDGKAGFTIARLSSFETWLKYKKLRLKNEATQNSRK